MEIRDPAQNVAQLKHGSRIGLRPSAKVESFAFYELPSPFETIAAQSLRVRARESPSY